MEQLQEAADRHMDTVFNAVRLTSTGWRRSGNDGVDARFGSRTPEGQQPTFYYVLIVPRGQVRIFKEVVTVEF